MKQVTTVFKKIKISGGLGPFLFVSALLHAGLLCFDACPPQIEGVQGCPPTVITLVGQAPAAMATPEPQSGKFAPTAAGILASAPQRDQVTVVAEPVARKKTRLESRKKFFQAKPSKRAAQAFPPNDFSASMKDRTRIEEALSRSGENSGTPPDSGSSNFVTEEGLVESRFGSREGPKVALLVQPEYPLRARRLRKEGLVLIHLHLDRNGGLHRATVVAKAGYGFDEAAMAAVKKSSFLPATRNGSPVPCLALLPVRFVLPTGI